MSFILQPVGAFVPSYPIPVPSGLAATGTPSATTFLSGAGTWGSVTVTGSSLYEWQNLAGDAAPLGVS
ncbi:MAG: hypothetical protein EB116_12080 [Betaproteobacteria bacterium]|nr:hypothetical protein [Betaproteobacteria bacterium]